MPLTVVPTPNGGGSSDVFTTTLAEEQTLGSAGAAGHRLSDPHPTGQSRLDGGGIHSLPLKRGPSYFFQVPGQQDGGDIRDVQKATGRKKVLQGTYTSTR